MAVETKQSWEQKLVLLESKLVHSKHDRAALQAMQQELLRLNSELPLNQMTDALSRIDALDEAIDIAIKDCPSKQHITQPTEASPVAERKAVLSCTIEEQQVLKVLRSLAANSTDTKTRNAAINHVLRFYLQLANGIGAVVAKQAVESLFYQAIGHNTSAHQQTTELPKLDALAKAILKSLDVFDPMLIEDPNETAIPTATQAYYLELLTQGQQSPLDDYIAIGLIHVYLILCKETNIFPLIAEIERDMHINDVLLDKETREITAELQEIRDLFRTALEGLNTDEQLATALNKFGQRDSILFDKQADPEGYILNLVLEQLAAAFCETLAYADNPLYREFFLREFPEAHREILQKWFLSAEFSQIRGQIRMNILQRHKQLYAQAFAQNNEAPWIDSLCLAVFNEAQHHVEQELKKKTESANIPQGMLYAVHGMRGEALAARAELEKPVQKSAAVQPKVQGRPYPYQ